MKLVSVFTALVMVPYQHANAFSIYVSNPVAKKNPFKKQTVLNVAQDVDLDSASSFSPRKKTKEVSDLRCLNNVLIKCQFPCCCRSRSCTKITYEYFKN